MVKISVILPVYGVSAYIEKCTASLLSQTLQEMEFLFVDDHGPDNSIELVQKMIENHPRKDQFRFLKPEHNMGAGMARNFGIPYATGEYISFVDSDDWVEPTMFEELYNKASALHTDLCCCQMQKVYPDGHKGDILQNPHIPEGPITQESRRHFLSNYVSLFASFIYRREWILEKQIAFPEDRCADDSYFVSCVVMQAQSISYVDKPFYQYLIRPGSVCTTKDSTKYQKRLTVFGKLMSYAKQQNIYQEFQPEVDFLYIKKGYLSSVFNYITNSTTPTSQTIRSIKDELVKQVPHYKDNPYLKSKMSMRCLIWLINAMPQLASKIIKPYARRKEMTV